MRVVVDTNVLLSGTISPAGAPGRVVAAWMARQFTAIMSPQMITELRDAARYPRVRRRIPINDRELATFLDELERAAVVVDPSVHIEAARDPDDNRVLEAAVAGDADYIVTGDGDLLALGSHDRIQIVTPAAFTTLLPQ